MRHRYLVEPRQVIFVGAEGKSEQAFAGFLQRCCEDKGLRLHLHVKLSCAGDTVSVVKEAGRHLERFSGRREVGRRLVLLDRDLVEGDSKARRVARTVAARWKLELIFQKPKLEGLLLRLHPGCERRRMPASTAEAELRKVWPEYRKPPTAAHYQSLRRRGRRQSESLTAW